MSSLLDGPDEIEETLTTAQLDKVAEQIRKADPYPMEQTKTRNILMLGRSGSGKTTAQDVIKDITAKTKNVGLFSDTVDPKFTSFSLTDSKATCKYTINIIDTPGVQEVKPIGQDARSDQAIMGTVKFCLKNEITRVHCLFIFVSFGGKINTSDKDAFKIYLDMFKHQTVRIGFCITRCEGFKPQEEQALIDDLRQDVYFKDVLEQTNVSVFFCGVMNPFILKNCSTEKALTVHYKDIHRRREKLLRYIFDAEEKGTMLYDFPIVSHGIDDINAKFKDLNAIIDLLTNSQDFSAGPIKNRIHDFVMGIEFLRKNESLFTNAELYETFTKMKERVKALQPKVPAEIWSTISAGLLF